MKRNHLNYFLLAIVLPLLAIISCEKNQGNGDGGNEPYVPSKGLIVGNCKNELDMGNGLGVGQEATFMAVTKLTADQLAAGGSTHIRALRLGIVSEASNLKAFVREQKDGDNLAEATFVRNEFTWSVAEFPEAFEIPTGKDLYIGYELSTAGYAIGFNGRTKSEVDEIFVGGEWLRLAAAIGKGHLAIQAILEGGDYSNMEPKQDLAFSNLDIPYNIVKNSTFEPVATITNNGINSVNECIIEGTYNEQPFTKELGNLNLKTGESTNVSLGMFTAPDTEEITKFHAEIILKDNVTDSYPKNNTISRNQLPYEGGYTRNQVLIEQFTGQDCPNCPGGARALTNTIANMKNPEKICWIAHHTYYTDQFSLPESAKIAQYMQVYAAPMAVTNRTPQNYGGTPELIMHPAGIRVETLDELSNMESCASMNLEHQFDNGSRELKVTVSGETKKENLKVTVVIIQNKISARQAGAKGSFEHNYAVRAFLTPALGEKLEVNGGKYTKSFSYKIPEKVGDFDVVLENVEVVAFIATDGNTVSQTPVLNADSRPLLGGSKVGISRDFSDIENHLTPANIFSFIAQ